MLTNPEAEISKELGKGEQLLWVGKSRQGIFFRGSDILLIPFSLMWGGFAIFWESMALSGFLNGQASKAPSGFQFIFPLFGVPFVLVGLYIILGRFIVDSKQRERTFYGITTQRIIIKSGLFSRSTKSLNLRSLSDISLSERSDGSGTITFGATNPFNSWFSAGSWPGAGKQSPSFDTIPNAKKVYEIIRKAQNET